MKTIANNIKSFIKLILARKFFYKLNKFIYLVSLNGMGILNHENEYISGEHAFLVKVTKTFQEKPIILDVGANVGRYSNLLRKLSPQTIVYAFEPHPKTFEILKKNAETHGYNAFQFGCGNKKSKLKLYDYEHQDGSSHASLFNDVIEKIHHKNSVEHSVNIIDLDSFLLDKNIEKVNLIKIDVEGNEYSVLEGLNKSITKGMIELIHFEFNEMNVVSKSFFKDFYEILSDYQLFRMVSDGLVSLGEYDPIFCEIYGFQNIVAIHKSSDFNP